MPFVYVVSSYGPVPSTPLSVRSELAGYLVLSTMAPAPVATLNGKVASGEDSRKVTVRPLAPTDCRVLSSEAGPTSELIFLTRSKEYLTSLAVISRPLGKVRPSRSTQRYVRRSLPSNPQLSAASGTGVALPGSKASSDWKTLLNSAQEPAS